MDVCRGTTFVPPVVSSAVRPSDAIEGELAPVSPLDRVWPVGVESKSAKRRRRMRNSASLKSQMRSQEVLALLRTGACDEPVPTQQGISGFLESRFVALESKLDLVLSVLSGTPLEPSVAWSPNGLVYLDHLTQTRNCEEPLKSAPSLEQTIEDNETICDTGPSVVGFGVGPLVMSGLSQVGKACAKLFQAKENQSTWEALPSQQTRMRRYCFKKTRPPPLTASSSSGSWMRVVWSSALELAADDIESHFSSYGIVTDLDWLDVENGNETMKLRFESRSSMMEAMKQSKHEVRREHDGQLIPVRVCVKFSDNGGGLRQKV